jgi:hypothetical protein
MNDNKMGDRGRCRGRGLECSDIDIVDVVALDLWLWEDVKKSNADESEFPCCLRWGVKMRWVSSHLFLASFKN